MKALLVAMWLWVLLWSSLCAAADPRVVSLSWEPTEHLLRLGITPIAVADAASYREWVVRPALPDRVPDVGTRVEPNMDMIAQLRPDLILITPLLEDIRPRLERIAPVVVYGDFTQSEDNLQLQRRNFLDLARRLGRQKQAQQQLAAMDGQLSSLRQQLLAHYKGQLPKISVLRFLSPTSVLIAGPNSMPDHAMQLLGLQRAYPVPVSRWGMTQKSVTSLGDIKEGTVLYLEPFPQRDRLFRTELWQQMPFVQRHRIATMGSVWTHGGLFCVEYLAEAISKALLGLPTP